MQDVVIIGGGLAGLVSALELARAGWAVTLVERKTYPFHKVCGEYVSNEVRPYVESLGVDLNALGAARITQFWLSAPSGRSLRAPLDLGGFGISRYTLDHALYELGRAAGVRFELGRTVEHVAAGAPPVAGADNVVKAGNVVGARNVVKMGNVVAAGNVVEAGKLAETNNVVDATTFGVTLNDGRSIRCRLVIGAFGKRSRLDKTLDRPFRRQSGPASWSPYVGVKYHIRTDFPDDLIALHNFADGYCGMSAIENGAYCLCYLTTRDNLRRHGSIPAMEQAVLHRNPHLRRVFEQSEFLYDKPEVINEISFAPKRAVDSHILMAGDSAGLITPLCGNGMAMAIHGAKLASSLATGFLSGHMSRAELEHRYVVAWQQRFARRLWVGRTVQRLFGRPALTEAAVGLFGAFRPALRGVMRQTHGNVVGV